MKNGRKLQENAEQATREGERRHRIVTRGAVQDRAVEMARSTRNQLGSAFFDRSPEVVARQLLGKVLRHRYQGEWLSGRITETEAYLGKDDPASHTFVGRTRRNQILFGPPGFAYVYLIYGMYNCLNVSCLAAGEPGGVLFRAIKPLEGVITMARLRRVSPLSDAAQIGGGPGRLCQALGISIETDNGLNMTRHRSTLHIIDDGCRVTHFDITPRVGISKAIDLPLRFVMPM